MLTTAEPSLVRPTAPSRRRSRLVHAGVRCIGAFVRVLVLGPVFALGLAGIARAQAPATPFSDTIEQRMQACTGCHGPRGAGLADVAFPRLAGQPADYLFGQMKAFRAGTRTYAPMNFLMARQTDAYLREIAEWFSQQSADPQVVERRRAQSFDRASFDAGARLVHDGRAGGQLPACASCHGSALGGTTGPDGGIPGLAGLPRDFLIEQVGSWKNGTHRSPEPNCMAAIAKRLSGDDIAAAATWLSLQPPATPVARDAALPVECGRP
jgi:cytochrome c553